MGGFADRHNGDKVRMLSYILMGILVLALAGITLWGIRYDPDKNSFMSIEDTTFLRGFWCIIVVLVHVPAAYQNRIQDMLGSFAYIGVTCFFMTSAYGLKWSIEHKKGYMDHFWRRRLPSIMVPAIIAYLLSCCIKLYKGTPITVFTVINVNPWVKVLLINYILFWIIYCLVPKKLRGVLARTCNMLLDYCMELNRTINGLVCYGMGNRKTRLCIWHPIGNTL